MTSCLRKDSQGWHITIDYPVVYKAVKDKVQDDLGVELSDAKFKKLIPLKAILAGILIQEGIEEQRSDESK